MGFDVQSAPHGDADRFSVRAVERTHRSDRAAGASVDDQHVGRRAAGRHARLRPPDRQRRDRRLEPLSAQPGHSRPQRRHRRMAEPALPPARGPARSDAARHPDRRQQGRRLHHLHGGDAAAEGGRQAGRGAAQPVLSGLSRRRGAVGRRALAGQRQCRDRLPARLRRRRRGDVEADVGGLSLLARQPAGRHCRHRLPAEASGQVPRARRRAGGR